MTQDPREGLGLVPYVCMYGGLIILYYVLIIQNTLYTYNTKYFIQNTL